MVICGLVNKMTQTVLLFIQTVHLNTAMMKQFILKSPYLIHCVFTFILDYSVDNVLKDSVSCTNDYIGLIIPFALAGIALVVLVTALT